MELKDFITEEYLKRFKVFKSTSLFDPEPKDLIHWIKQSRCPLCQRKLYWNLKGDKAFCKSKVKDKFFITKEAFSKFL